MAKRKRRHFTPEFKAKVVLEALRGESSQAELCRRHNLSEEQLSTWKRQLLENAASLFESRGKPSKETKARIAELEQLVGGLKVAMDIQKKALDLLGETPDPNAQGGRVHLNDAEAITDVGAHIGHFILWRNACIRR